MHSLLNLFGEWCHRLHIEECDCSYLVQIFERKYGKSRSKSFSIQKSVKAAILFYEEFRSRGFVLGIEDVSRVSGIPRKKLWTYIRFNDLKTDLRCDIIHLMEIFDRYVALFNLPKELRDRVRCRVQMFEGYISFSPKTLIAYAIYEILNPGGKFERGKHSSSIREICRTMEISATSFFRFKKLVGRHGVMRE